MPSIRILVRAACAAGLALSTLLAHAELPAGKIGINYSRCDGNYEGWGLHIWKNPGVPLPGVEWATPMPPAGNNDFGVYWLADDNAFGSSMTVNYIIHKGDTKEQGGRDMKFDGKAHKEIWVNAGDRKIYYSLEEARKAREESPCK
ncbi:MAG: hypothetical protein RJA44_2732 [Pseudomonadota bacterium]|jgi:hypothetical protein